MNEHKKAKILNSINEHDVVKLCKELIKIPSFSGEEKPVADLLNRRLKSSGLRTKIDKFGNLIAILRGGNPGPKLMFNGHMDIALIGRRELWKQDPFSPVIKGGVLYGRGASDMKAAVTAMTVAAETLSRYRESLRGELILTFVAREERGNGMNHILQDGALIPNWAIVGEATNMNIVLGHLYGCMVEVKVSGQSVHQAHFPQKGVDAVGNMLDLIQEIKKLKLPSDKRLGKSYQCITTITAEPNQEGLINDLCTARLMFHIAEIGKTPEAPVDQLMATLKETIANLKLKKRNLEAEVKVLSTLSSFYTSPRDPKSKPLISSLRRNIKTVTNKIPHFSTWLFSTDGGHLARFVDVAVVGFGPASEFDAHVPTDCVKISQVIEATKVYILTAFDLLG